MIDLTPTISVFEVLWTVLAALGGVYAVMNMREAISDWQTVKAVTPPDARHLIARKEIRVEAGRVVALLGFVGLGLIAFTRSPGTTPSTILQAAIFVVIEATLVANSVLDHRARRVIVENVLLHAHSTRSKGNGTRHDD